MFCQVSGPGAVWVLSAFTDWSCIILHHFTRWTEASDSGVLIPLIRIVKCDPVSDERVSAVCVMAPGITALHTTDWKCYK